MAVQKILNPSFIGDDYITQTLAAVCASTAIARGVLLHRKNEGPYTQHLSIIH
jgi:hypothetical protein